MNKKSPDAVSHVKLVLYGATNWTLFFAGLANLAVGTWSAINLQVAVAATSLTAGLVLLFAATIDRFESLKGLGIEAKTRQLDQKIEEADEALNRLKELTELTCKVFIDHNSKMGRLDSAPRPRDAYGLAQNVRAIMQAQGSEPIAIRAALKPWIRITLIDIAFALTHPVRREVVQRLEEVERVRASTPNLTTDDPSYIRMTAELKDATNYMNTRLNNVGSFQVEDFPNRFVQIFDDIPLLSAEASEAHRSRAIKFTAAMSELISDMRIADPEPWFEAIESDRAG